MSEQAGRLLNSRCLADGVFAKATLSLIDFGLPGDEKSADTK